jgi:hypothetical protein
MAEETFISRYTLELCRESACPQLSYMAKMQLSCGQYLATKGLKSQTRNAGLIVFFQSHPF